MINEPFMNRLGMRKANLKTMLNNLEKERKPFFSTKILVRKKSTMNFLFLYVQIISNSSFLVIDWSKFPLS